MAVNNISPVATYIANGITSEFSFSFKIIKNTDVKLFVDNIEKNYSTDYTVDILTGILTTVAIPANGAVIRLQRDTSLNRDIDYAEGGGLSSAILDADLDKITLLIQDQYIQSLTTDVGSDNYNVNNTNIVNVGSPVNNNDAANKVYVDASTLIITDHIADVVNPHGVTKTQIGLVNVDNTADADKPVSVATQTALNLKANTSQVLTNVPSGAVFTDTLYSKVSIDAMLINAATLDGIDSSGFALLAHNHSGTYANNTHTHNEYEPLISKASAFNKHFGSTVNTVCDGNDSRLSDNRTPHAHTHQVTDILNIDTDKYTQAEVDGLLVTKQNILDKQLDQVSDILVYKAYALTGSLTSESTWSIAKYAKSGDVWTTTYPNADDTYSYIWNDRLSYLYS